MTKATKKSSSSKKELAAVKFARGYVENVSENTYYAVKRSINPGERVSFDYLYNVISGEEGIYEKDDNFINHLKSRFHNTMVWKVTYGSVDKSLGKVRAAGGLVETTLSPEDVDLNKIMSKTTGINPIGDLPTITPEMLIKAGTVDKIEELVGYVKSPSAKKKLLKQAAELARNRPNKEVHFRIIDRMMERLLIK